MRGGNYLPLCTIAGSDPTGGAGLQGDLKTFAAHGAEGTAVVTAVTVQGAAGVRQVQAIPPDVVAAQLRVVREEVRPSGWKTGMLWSASTIAVVVETLARRGSTPLVVDPVLGATAGGALLEPGALDVLRELLLPLADVLTPNLPEAARLLGREDLAEEEADEAARALLALGPRAVLLKGGHGQGPQAVDVLATPRGVTRLALPRLAGPAAHGTGCALAAALASRLATGVPLPEAARAAKAYVHRALAAGTAGGRPGLVHAVPSDP